MVPRGHILRDVICVLTLPYCWLLVEVLAVQRPVSTLACSSIPVRLSRRDHSSTLCWCKGMDPLPLAVEGITSISVLLHSLIWGNTHFGHVILTKWHLPETEMKIRVYQTSVRILNEVFLNLTEGFPCFFFSCKANARVKFAKTGHGPHSSTLLCICVVLCIVCV